MTKYYFGFLLFDQLMQRKRNKKLIKFQRKPVQQSNCLYPIFDEQKSSNHSTPSKTLHHKKTKKTNDKIGSKKQQASIFMAEKDEHLELPRQWKIDGAVDNPRKRLISVIEQKKPLLSVQIMFNNKQLRNILGATTDSFRQSQLLKSRARKKNRQSMQNHHQQQRRQSIAIGQTKVSYHCQPQYKHAEHEQLMANYNFFHNYHPTAKEQQHQRFGLLLFQKNDNYSQQQYPIKVRKPMNNDFREIVIPSQSKPTNFLDLLVDSQQMQYSSSQQDYNEGYPGYANTGNRQQSTFRDKLAIPNITSNKHVKKQDYKTSLHNQYINECRQLPIVFEQVSQKRSGYLPE